MALLSKQTVAALLGRPLTTVEDTNFDLYLEIAKNNVSDILCIDICKDSGERVFERRQEFATVFTGIFSNVNSVKVDGVEVVDFLPYFFNKRTGDFYNSIVFDNLPRGTEITVDADWGFNTLPIDIKRMISQAFAVVSSSYQTKDVRSKQIEDFRTTYGELTSDEVFASSNARTIQKYSLCTIGDLTSGNIC